MAKKKKPAIRFKGFMEEWEERKIKEDFEIVTGGTPSTANNNFWFPKQIPWLSSGEVHKKRIWYTDELISEQGFNNSSAKWVKENSILIALAGQGKTRGTVAINGIPLTTNQSIAAIIPNCDINYEFIFSNLERRYEEIRMLSSTDGCRGGLNKQMVSDIVIPFTSKEEQQKIGAFFRNLDYLITLHQRKYDKLQNIKKSMLEKMFPKNRENIPEIYFKGFTEVWEQRKLGEYGYFYYGHSAPKWSVAEDAKIPCVRYGELYTKFGYKIDKVYSYTNIPKENLIFSKGTEVLIPRVGEDPFDYNHCAWISLSGVAIGEMISVYNTKQNPLFTVIMFNATLREEFAKRVEGGSVTNLYYEKLNDIDISFPCMKEQIKIAKYFYHLDHLINLHKRKLKKLQDIKKSCLEKMFV